MKRDIEFLFEMGRLRFGQRNWQRFFNTKVANDSEHTFRVLWIALTIAKREGVADIEKIMKMALVHDIAESRTGDVDYISRSYAKLNEEDAIKDVLEETSVEDEFIESWEEFEKRETIESKIVKDADNLDIDFELMEQMDANEGLIKKKISMRKSNVRQKLFTETAKKMFDEVYSTEDIHDWHFESKRNRFKNGDFSLKDKEEK